VALTERGTNNRTLQMTAGDHRWSLRISQNLTPAQVQAEHRLLARLARAGLSFAVPSPVPLPDGSTVAGTAGGPAALCEWIPGVQPDLSQEAALERSGRDAAELSDALAAVPPQDTPNDWQDGPLPAARGVSYARVPSQVVRWRAMPPGLACRWRGSACRGRVAVLGAGGAVHAAGSSQAGAACGRSGRAGSLQHPRGRGPGRSADD